jgi:hypothetical protein
MDMSSPLHVAALSIRLADYLRQGAVPFNHQVSLAYGAEVLSHGLTPFHLHKAGGFERCFIETDDGSGTYGIIKTYVTNGSSALPRSSARRSREPVNDNEWASAASAGLVRATRGQRSPQALMHVEQMLQIGQAD